LTRFPLPNPESAAGDVCRVNGVELYYELSGSGEPLVLVHGSWGDHHNWDAVAGSPAQSFQVLTFDRRGHSASERPAGKAACLRTPTISQR
jgi:pimeloyl-ACP methyl ester carboxylesterase